MFPNLIKSIFKKVRDTWTIQTDEEHLTHNGVIPDDKIPPSPKIQPPLTPTFSMIRETHPGFDPQLEYLQNTVITPFLNPCTRTRGN